MIELWVPITIAAAFAQNLRFMLQKHLKGELSTFGTTYSRFLWAAPLAILVVLLILKTRDADLPGMNASFWRHAITGGISQILATALLVTLFGMRNFAVGVTFSSTETVLTALLGVMILGEGIGVTAFWAIVISLLGVMLMSLDFKDFGWRSFASPSMFIGLGAGALFGLSAVSYRGASLALESGDFLIRAAVTLAVVTLMQTILMSLYLAWREPGEIGRVIAKWRVTIWVGVTGMLGSLGWFAAMTLQNAAYVRALGQIELLFSFVASYLFFKERSSPKEITGILLVVAGILILLLGR